MLILTRKPGESVYIGDDIKVTLMEIKGNQVRVGVDAPRSVKIYREEIYLQILEENRTAAEASTELPADLDAMAAAWKDQKSIAIDQLKADKKKGKRNELQPCCRSKGKQETMREAGMSGVGQL